ncbi:DEAD/DEAH box helicase [Parasphaerochaeta coccoides]|uniref:RNA helicase n=1 Tax=Parasphaerochaeta coccoides (strain ATCC BAA-1237 / DSM 17374 / SPN1) TaxID=760011 RepID=F4GH60_PARC1|nr:DEAD/DEAH box helicase [Parasphaerochaeta coccoides]AEC01535.1 DEAD/DEAH box helicase domain protein [Parasphaerochaeta coccoides DSM 17374]
MPDTVTFADLGLSARTLDVLKKKGFEEPTQIQKECIPLLLHEKTDVIGQARTGTGKTAAFGIPILETVDEHDSTVQALILAPTRELAVQVADEISSMRPSSGLSIAAIYGGASMSLQLRQLHRGVQIVVGTPGRVQDHLDRGTLNLENLKFMVLDEADEMLDMGFIEDIENILSRTPADKRMLCFSATMPAPIQNLAQRFMKDPKIVRVVSQDMTNLLTNQVCYEVRESDKLEALCRVIDVAVDFYGLVFCRTKLQCDEVTEKLVARGQDADALHGDLSQKQREAILNRFRRRQLSVLVATDVAARGIDIPDLTHVINYSIPQNPEAYIHRIGRTGRAGRSGTAVTFITPREYSKLKYIQRIAHTEIHRETVPAISDIMEAKRNRIATETESLLTVAESDQFRPLARHLLESHAAEDVVAALLTGLNKNALDESRYTYLSSDATGRRKGRFAETVDPESGLVRLFISRGTKDGLNRELLQEYVSNATNGSVSRLSDIDIGTTYSFASATPDDAKAVIDIFALNAPEGEGPLVTKAKPEPSSSSFHRRTPSRKAYQDRPRRTDRYDFKDEAGYHGGRERAEKENDSARSGYGEKRRSHGKYTADGGSGKGRSFKKEKKPSVLVGKDGRPFRKNSR